MHEPSLLRLAGSMPCVCQGFTTLHARAEPTEACGWHDMCVSGLGSGLGSHARTELVKARASMPCVCQGYTALHVRAEPTEACGWHDMCVLGSGLGLGSHA